jgi:hypothetical protein
MAFRTGDAQTYQEIDEHTEQHQEYIDRFAPCIEYQGEAYQYQVLSLIIPRHLFRSPFTVCPCCQEVAHQEGWQENEEEK